MLRILELMVNCVGWAMVGAAMIASWWELVGMDPPACCEELGEMSTLARSGELVGKAMLAS